MGIYIKNMKMPKNCSECNFVHTTYYLGRHVCLARNMADIEVKISSGIDAYCPLVEVPTPHGDLIDRDALEADILPEWNGVCVPDNAYSEKLIRNATAVIPREDGETNVDAQ